MTDQKESAEQKQSDLQIYIPTVSILLILISLVFIVPAIVYYSARSEAKVGVCRAISVKSIEASDPNKVFSFFRECLEIAD